MRSLRLGLASLLCLAAACSGQDTGLLDLTLNADATNPPPHGAAVDLMAAGGIHRSFAIAFPPDGASSLRLEYPDLPTGTITLTVQTLDNRGCVLGESPAPFAVAIKAGAKVAAAVTIQKSTKPCGDGGNASPGLDAGVDAGHADEAGEPDTGTGPVDTAVDLATDVAERDTPAIDAGPVDLPVSDSPPDMPLADVSPSIDSPPDGADAPFASGPTILSFTASPATISAGSSTTLTAIFTSANWSSIDHGIGTVTSGTSIGTGRLSATTTYQLTVIDSTGNSVTRQVTVMVVPLPSISSFSALMPTVASGTLTALAPVFTGGTGSVDTGIGPVTSDTPVPTGVLFANSTFTLTVTNAAGDSATSQVTVMASAAVGTGVFTATGSLSLERGAHTATLLPNGKVLVAGGDHTPTGATDIPPNGELYDSSAGNFTLTGAMSTHRDGHTATLLPNGKVLVAGGWGNGIAQTSADLYDTETGSFVPTGSLGTGRTGHTATLLPGGKVLVAGGQGNSGSLSSAELYDASTGTFIPTGGMTAIRQYLAASILPNGQVMVCGGEDLVGVNNPILASADAFDPGSAVFAGTGAMNIARIWHTATLLLSGEVLIIGGANNTATVAAAELYDQSSGTFSLTGATTDPRSFHSATLLPNGKVLVAGGSYFLPGPSANTVVSSAELYDPNSRQFTATGSMTGPREGHTATLLQNGKVLITSGSSAELYW